LFTPPWIVLHCFAVVLTVGFLVLGWWQLGRAQHGNAISWGYALEWPAFAVFTLVLWIRQMRLELRKDRPARTGKTPEPPPMTSPYEQSILKSRDSIPGSTS
jgi:DNA-binding transcriptional regulator of glucitol operon